MWEGGTDDRMEPKEQKTNLPNTNIPIVFRRGNPRGTLNTVWAFDAAHSQLINNPATRG